MTEHPLDRTQALPTEALNLRLQQQSAESGAPALRGSASLHSSRSAEFRTGVASVPAQRTGEQTFQFEPGPPPGQVLTSSTLKKPDVPLKVRMRTLRSGGKWSVTGGSVLLFCWGLWAGAGQAGLEHTALILFAILAVAVGLFGVLRLAGGAVLEKMFGRTRRGAVGSHMVVGLFLVLAGYSLLRQTEWIVDLFFSS